MNFHDQVANQNLISGTQQDSVIKLKHAMTETGQKILCFIIKGSLEEKLPSYEKLRSACVQVRDAKRSRLTVARVGTLGAAQVRRMCGAVAAAAPVEIEA